MRMVMPTMDAKRHVLCYYRQPFDVEIFLGNLSVKISKMNLYISNLGTLWQIWTFLQGICGKNVSN